MTCHNWALTAETKSHIGAADEVASRKRLTSLLKLAHFVHSIISWILSGQEFIELWVNQQLWPAYPLLSNNSKVNQFRSTTHKISSFNKGFK